MGQGIERREELQPVRCERERQEDPRQQEQRQGDAVDEGRQGILALEDQGGAVRERREREANVFAAELLMPEFAVRAAWQEAGEAEDLATHFDVSLSAMHWRLYSFGFLPAPQA